MTVYIVLGVDIDHSTILSVCDTEFLALKRKAHFQVSHADLDIKIESHYVDLESQD